MSFRRNGRSYTIEMISGVAKVIKPLSKSVNDDNVLQNRKILTLEGGKNFAKDKRVSICCFGSSKKRGRTTEEFIARYRVVATSKTYKL